MKLIDSIWNKIVEIENRSLDKPTHIEIPRDMIPVLVAEYQDLQSMDYDYDHFFQNSNKKYTILDLEDYFGNVTFTVSLRSSNDIKILKEITPNS